MPIYLLRAQQWRFRDKGLLRMFKKWQIKKLFVAFSAATKTGENVEGQIMGKRPKPHIGLREHDQHSF